nr:MAG TPA: hypothetical protein [Caudoviricetes sp.]
MFRARREQINGTGSRNVIPGRGPQSLGGSDKCLTFNRDSYEWEKRPPTSVCAAGCSTRTHALFCVKSPSENKESPSTA